MAMAVRRRVLTAIRLPAGVGALAVLLLACGGTDRRGGAAPVERDSVGIRIVESAAPRVAESGAAASFVLDTVPQVSIGVEEGDEAYQLYRVSDAHRLPDGRIIVSNSGSHELRVFDAAGQHLLNLGRQGSGPGEFGDFSSARLHSVGDSILATDDGAFRVHIYTPDPEFVETRSFVLTGKNARPFLRGVFADRSWLVLAAEGGGALRGDPGTVIGMRFTLLRYSDAGVLVDSLFSFDGAARLVHQLNGITHFPYIPFSTEALYGVDGDGFVVMRGDAAELEFRDRDGRVQRIVRWPRERVPSAQMWPEYKARSIARLAGSDERQRTLYSAFYERDLPLPEYAPMYQSLKVAADRRIWLERYRLPGDTAARTWDVIDTDGAWLGTVHVPRQLTLYRVGTDALLGRSLDSLGVERVELYGMRSTAR